MGNDKFMDSGIFLLDKAAGLSSAAELNKLKKKLKLNKVGHAGTLDPMATGLLVCLVNSATRLASFAEKGRKVYTGTIRFGIKTDTDDIKGNVIKESNNIPAFDVIKESSLSFLGEIEQYPPSVSAVRIGGVRAYKIARRGEVPDIKPRRVLIHEFTVSDYSENEISFRIECNSGTYIRSIARDMGEKLGCGACLSSLRREYSFPFDVKNARSIEEIESSDMFSWTNLFPEMKHISLEKNYARKISDGGIGEISVRLGEIISEQLEDTTQADKVIYFGEETSRPLGILNYNAGQWEIAVNLR